MWPATKCLVRGQDCSLLLGGVSSLWAPGRGLVMWQKPGQGRAESGGRAPADHEHAPLQLPQVDPHLGAVAGFPHPDLVGTHRTDHTADLRVLFRLQVNSLALVVPSLVIVEFAIFYPSFKSLCWRLCWCSWEVLRRGGGGWSLGWFKLIQCS